MRLQEPMKARVLICDVIRQSGMTGHRSREYLWPSENTSLRFFSHFSDHCVVSTFLEFLNQRVRRERRKVVV